MDVTCPRCQTDYEFDDALVSERGTTVKCTNCGHQFRVFRPRSSQTGAAPASPELWKIERRDGEPLELRSLVELQRAIRAGRVSRNDLLRRGDSPARRVSDIPELEPFFPAQRVDMPQNTLPLPAATQAPIPVTRVPAHTPAYGKAPQTSQAPQSPPGRVGSGTLRPPGAVPPPAQSAGGSSPGATFPKTTQAQIAAPTEGSWAGGTKRSNPPPPPPGGVIHTPLGLSPWQPPDALAGTAPMSPAARLQTPLPKVRTPPPPNRPSAERSDRVSLEQLASQLGREEPEPPTQKRIDVGGVAEARRVDPSAPTAAMREADEPPPPGAARQELYDSLFPVSRPKRGGGAKWVVALLLVAGLGVAGATVGRPYLTRIFAGEASQGSASASSTASANKLQDALTAADRARAEGDFRVASDAYQRATEADDKSIAAWDGLCTAQSEYALLIWLDALANGSSVEHQQATSIGGSAGKSCARWGELARATPEGAKKVDDDLRPARALAAQGSTAALRYFLPSHANDPILQALVQLSDATSGDAAAVAKSAKAASAMLDKVDLSTLATPGDVAVVAFVAAIAGPPSRLDEALAELSRRAPRHMLIDTLKQLGTRGDAGPAGPDAGGKDAGGADAKVASASTGGTSAPGPTEDANDYREMDRKGHEALASGDVGKAETMFRAAQAQNPNDIDSMYGLAQIERSHGNHAGAIEGFKNVLSRSPGYGPARLSLADEQWGSSQGEAIANYKLYLEGNGSGPGADRARSRIASVEGTTTTAPTDTATAPSPTTTSPPPETSATP